MLCNVRPRVSGQPSQLGLKQTAPLAFHPTTHALLWHARPCTSVYLAHTLGFLSGVVGRSRPGFAAGCKFGPKKLLPGSDLRLVASPSAKSDVGNPVERGFRAVKMASAPPKKLLPGSDLRSVASPCAKSDVGNPIESGFRGVKMAAPPKKLLPGSDLRSVASPCAKSDVGDPIETGFRGVKMASALSKCDTQVTSRSQDGTAAAERTCPQTHSLPASELVHTNGAIKEPLPARVDSCLSLVYSFLSRPLFI